MRQLAPVGAGFLALGATMLWAADDQPRKAQEHYYALREAKPDLVGTALYDRLAQAPPANPTLKQLMWRKREIENYLCQRETLLVFAEARGRASQGELFAASWRAGRRVSDT